MGFYSEFETSLMNSCKTVFPTISDQNIIFSDQDGQEPKDTYIDINIISLDQIGSAYTSTLTNEAQKLTIQSDYEGLVRFLFTGKESDSYSSDFHFALENVVIWEKMRTFNLGIMRKSKIQRVPDKRETTIIKRFSLDVTFSFAATVDQYVDVIEHIGIESDLYDGAFLIP